MKKLCSLSLDYTGDLIKNEPMLFSASPFFAVESGGPITKEVMQIIRREAGEYDTNMIIDTRVHMLKPGWFPSIPGWHLDAIPRDEDKKVDFSHPIIPHIHHYLFLLDFNTGSMTEYCDADVLDVHTHCDIRGHKNVWGAHSEYIEDNRGYYNYGVLENASLYRMEVGDYHRAMPATGHGWRYFFRASVNTLTRGPFNEIRNQVQIYIPDEHLGW